MNDWLVIAVIYGAVFVSGPLIAVLHELGHALAYLLLTKPDRIDIYIGTYRLPQRPIYIRTGKLHFFIKRSFPFVKGIGLCRSYKPETNYLNNIIILLAGAVFTFLAAGVVSIIVFYSNAGLLVKIVCYVFLGFSALSLIGNLVPREIDLLQSVSLDNDGQQILFTLKLRKALRPYAEALQFIGDKELEPAIGKLKIVLEQAPDEKKVLRLIIKLLMDTKQFNEATLYLDMLERKHSLLKNDVLHRGILQSIADQHDDAIKSYSRVLKMDKKNLLALNNIGAELIEQGAHEVAKRALDRAIKLNPKFDAPYCSVGYSKILQGDLMKGKVLVDKCIELNPANADARKALGIYYLRLKDAGQAGANFNKARDLNAEIGLGVYADELKVLVETSSVS